jgi:hypothetical protein
MEVKVDVRKLQLLCDRINQTIEALNQVRMSVHGLAHATAFSQPWSSPQAAYATPFAATGTTGWTAPVGGVGLQHTAGFPVANALLGYANPYGAIGGGAFGSIDLDPRSVIERQAAELRASDPGRVAQTFPYAYLV